MDVFFQGRSNMPHHSGAGPANFDATTIPFWKCSGWIPSPSSPLKLTFTVKYPYTTWYLTNRAFPETWFAKKDDYVYRYWQNPCFYSGLWTIFRAPKFEDQGPKSGPLKNCDGPQKFHVKGPNGPWTFLLILTPDYRRKNEVFFL